MGISGLLPLLKSIHKHTSLKKFAGQTIGVDAYGWLHRGSVACAIELALGKPTTKYIDFAVNRVRMLLDFGITPYLVFDGDALPSKSHTNEERRNKREESKALGLELYKSGKISQAYQELQKSAAVTPLMARQLIEELKKLDVSFLVAPFEADAQLAYLECKGIIDGILSEDSDLLVFGAKRLLTKLDQYGDCIEINRVDFPLCKEISLVGWTDTMFRRMAILSGCDYLQNIEKMGLKTAYRFIRKYKDGEKAIRMIAFEGRFAVPPNYLEQFKRADMTFVHHRVFCPIEKRMVHLNDLGRDTKQEEMPYLGAYVDAEIAIGVACGDLNPKTKLPIDISTINRSRPTLSEHRRTTFATPQDLKPKKSIDSFFQAQRRPLAELDPNSLTPSPSQQRLLQRHRQSSWEPRTVSSAPQLRQLGPSSIYTDLPQTPPTISNHQRFLSKASTMSTYQPPKRQRLCSESDGVYPSKDIDESPFFTSKHSKVSSSVLPKSKDKRVRRSEFDVWSDDSVEQIMLGLEDVQEAATPEHRGSVFDPRTQPDSESDIHGSTCEPLGSSPLGNRISEHKNEHMGITENDVIQQSPTFVSQRSTVDQDDGLEKFEDLLEYHVRQRACNLSKTFAYQSPERQIQAFQTLKSSSCEMTNLSQSKDKISSLNLRKPTKSSASSSKLDICKTFAYQSPEHQEIALKSLSQTRKEKIRIGHKALIKDSVATSTETAVSQLSKHLDLTGSEDLIIANSEDDENETDTDPPQLAIELGRFAYES